MPCACRSARVENASLRQLATESLALAAIGCAAAIPVAYGLHGALVRMIAESDPRFYMRFELDAVMLAFLLGTTVGAALLFGAFPAWQVARTDAGETLKDQRRGAIGSLRQLRSGQLLVSLQLALSLPLLVGAGLLVRTVYNLQRADLGFTRPSSSSCTCRSREATQGERRGGTPWSTIW